MKFAGFLPILLDYVSNIVSTVALEFHGGGYIYANLKCKFSARRTDTKTQVEFKVLHMTFGVPSDGEQTPGPTSGREPGAFIYKTELRVKPPSGCRTERATPGSVSPTVITNHSTTWSVILGINKLFACGLHKSMGYSTSSEAYGISPAYTNHSFCEVAWYWLLQMWADGSKFSIQDRFYTAPKLPDNLTTQAIQFSSPTGMNAHSPLDMLAVWEVDNHEVDPENICWDIDMDLWTAQLKKPRIWFLRRPFETRKYSFRARVTQSMWTNTATVKYV